MYVRMWPPTEAQPFWLVAFLSGYGVGATKTEALAALREDLLYV